MGTKDVEEKSTKGSQILSDDYPAYRRSKTIEPDKNKENPGKGKKEFEAGKDFKKLWERKRNSKQTTASPLLSSDESN